MQVIGGILAIIGGIIAVSGEAFPTKLAAVPGKNCTNPLTKTASKSPKLLDKHKSASPRTYIP
jgi:hypothetical protein